MLLAGRRLPLAGSAPVRAVRGAGGVRRAGARHGNAHDAGHGLEGRAPGLAPAVSAPLATSAPRLQALLCLIGFLLGACKEAHADSQNNSSFAMLS